MKAANGLLIVLCVAGCATTDQERQGRIVRDTFERWNEALARGDVEAGYAGMSDGFKSHWLWARLRDRNDTVTQAHLAKLDPALRGLLDVWFNAHEKEQPQRAELLPQSLLNSRWLFDLYREHLTREKQTVTAEAKVRTVREVYLDETGATVTAETLGILAMYAMVVEGGRWKIDGYRQAVRPRK
ncbi:MAG: hypothetical protein HYY16_12465 [Planctomycetes bacterium]|nr:hypothetical protein [Planctomycetota bacterium]